MDIELFIYLILFVIGLVGLTVGISGLIGVLVMGKMLSKIYNTKQSGENKRK